MIRRTSRVDGFSLLEVMIASVILATGLLAIALAQVSALKMGSRSKHLTDAVYLAQEQIETFQALPATDTTFSTPATDFNDPVGYILAGGDAEFGIGGWNPEQGGDQTVFTRRWTIQPNTPSTGLTRITVEVRWSENGGATPSGSTSLVWIKGSL
jgi:prepilin-type N-terminal cleavage/methylation domain-containing protein